MKKSYEENLPEDYFGSLLIRVSSLLVKGENVCISAMRGCGRKTFINFFLKIAKSRNIFDSYYLYDPISNGIKLTKFVKNTMKNDAKRKLFLVSLFESVENKKEMLEEIQLLRQPDPFYCVFLVFTDHTGILDQSDYLAITSPFFGGRFNLGPFSRNQTAEMIKVNNIFYGWDTPSSLADGIYDLSGGIPRLVKHISKEIFENSIPIARLDQFVTNPSIAFQLGEMSKIVYSTNKVNLKLLGIVDDKGKFKSKLLEYFFKVKKDKIVSEVYPQLTNLESKVFSCLYENKNKIINIDQIGDFLEMTGYDFSLWAIYKLISRLKQKIKANFRIENLKGRGYRLKLV